MAWTLGELARRVDGVVLGAADRRIEGIRPLRDAGPEQLSFVTAPRYLAAARASRAGALLVGGSTPEIARDRIRVERPAVALATLLDLFHPPARRPAGVHPTAIVAADARVHGEASIGPYAVIAEGAEIGAGAVVGAHAVVGAGSAVGERSTLHPHVVLYPGVRLGEDVVVHSGTVLGADGFGYAAAPEGHRKLAQVGGVRIGDRVEIGALTAVDRGMLDDTEIGDGTKIDNQVQVGHNAVIGRDVLLCGQVGISGSARVGDGAVFAGGSGMVDHAEVGAGAMVGAVSVVMEDVAPGKRVAGVPAVDLGEWKRRRVVEGRLVEIWRTVRRLVDRLDRIGGERQGGNS